MINQQQVDEVLKKTQEIEKQIEENKQKRQAVSEKLIALNTQKKLLLADLETLGINEDNLESKIEELYVSVKSGIAKYEESNK